MSDSLRLHAWTDGLHRAGLSRSSRWIDPKASLAQHRQGLDCHALAPLQSTGARWGLFLLKLCRPHRLTRGIFSTRWNKQS